MTIEPIIKEQPEFDMLRMYFGDDYKLTDRIIVHQPTIGEILEYGEQKMYSSIAPLIYNPTTYRVLLWDMGVDWNKISDYELFVSLATSMHAEDTQIFFGDFDFSKLKAYQSNETNEVIFLDEKYNLVFDESTYTCLSKYLRTMLNIHPKVEKAKGKTTKRWIIEEEKQNIKLREEKNAGFQSMLLPLVSGLVNNPGFKYKTSELKEIGIVEFMDSVQRLQVYEHSRALMSGIYSGMIDTKKIKNLDTQLNWLRDIYSST